MGLCCLCGLFLQETDVGRSSVGISGAAWQGSELQREPGGDLGPPTQAPLGEGDPSLQLVGWRWGMCCFFSPCLAPFTALNFCC